MTEDCKNRLGPVFYIIFLEAGIYQTTHEFRKN